MVVNQVLDHSLREVGRQFITSLKASNRYSESYLTSLETTRSMDAVFAEGQWWPGVRGITVSHMGAYLANFQERTRWFGDWNTPMLKLESPWPVPSLPRIQPVQVAAPAEDSLVGGD